MTWILALALVWGLAVTHATRAQSPDARQGTVDQGSNGEQERNGDQGRNGQGSAATIR